MDENARSMTSSETTKKFKTKISKCLPLLGLLNVCDKEEVWRFWKTVSAAVKIAVNGKGNISDNPKRQHKHSVLATSSEIEKNRLQELDENAISVYVPLKSSNTERLKYRVLKFVDQKKVADYFEEVQQVVSVDRKVQRQTNPDYAGSDNDDRFSENADTYVDGLQPSILSPTTKDDTEEKIKSVSNDPKRMYSKPITQITTENVMCSAEINSLSSLKSAKSQSATTKVWPVGRPTTRSFSSGTKISSVPNFVQANFVQGKLFPNTNSPVKTEASQKQNERGTVTQQPDMNHGGSQRKLRSVPNIKIVQDAKSSSQADFVEIHAKFDDNTSELQTKETTEVLSIDSVKHFVPDTLQANEIRVTNALEYNRDEAVNSNADGYDAHNVVSGSSSDQQQSQSGQPRNSSDIETIISALEEELKKSGSSLTGISVSGQTKHWPVAISTTHASSSSHSSVTASNADITKCTSNTNTKETKVASTIVDDTQSPYLSLQEAIEKQEVVPSGMKSALNHSVIEGSGQQILDASVQTTAYVDESGQPIKLHPAPLRVAAYIDELGQPIQTDQGQMTTLINESGQPVQILHGQEIVEVEGSIDNIIWACDGEVQILQQEQQGDGVQSQEAIPQHQEIDASQLASSLAESQPVQANYDVVEYEVLSDKRLKRGRKRKIKTEGDSQEGGDNDTKSNNTNSEVVDRTCPICHRVLNYVSSMKAHMRIHTGARPYSCGQCDRKFTTKANRDRHEATHVGLKPFKCEECHKSFTEKRSLKIHMRSHTGERPYVCEICGQGFAQNCTLQVHKVRHTDRRAHLCDLCGKAFRQKSQLEVHVKRHNRQAAYPCEHCETRCYTRGDLVRHMIKHTGERPYTCKLCPRAFTRKQYLIDHENQHYNRKPYRCSVCGMSFHDMGSCHRHLRKHKSAKDENVEEEARLPTKLPVLNVDVVHKMLDNAKPGQVLKLEDGSDAIVKQVTNDADGSTVYHITCLNVNSSTSIPSLTHYQHQQDQGAQPQINQEISDADSLALSQEATVKVENTEIIASQDHASYQASDIPKVEDLAAVTTENHKTGVTN